MGTLPETYDQAIADNPFRLAEQWGAVHERSNLGDLAAMTALSERLHGWIPLGINRALRNGASVEAVAEATGYRSWEVADVWHAWARQQRDLFDDCGIGLTAAEYEQVAGVLTEAVAS